MELTYNHMIITKYKMKFDEHALQQNASLYTKCFH
jgi:hypothetical protein